jgi:glycosyltransferase involved in cell wall biosynthesis
MKTCEFAIGALVIIFIKVEDNKNIEIPRIKDEDLPFVSYILPTYNAEKYLVRCLDSIFSQDYPKNKYEVIVADGGSTDSTLKILKNYSILLIHNEKVNSDYGKYLAINESKGQIIAFIDSDNIISGSSWLNSLVYPLLSNSEVGFVESNYLIADDFTSINTYANLLVIVDPLARMLATKPCKTINKDKYDLKVYKRGSSVVAGANGFLYRREHIINNLNHLTKRFAETNLITYIAKNSDIKIANIKNQGVYHYYCNGISDYINKRRKIGSKHLSRKKVVSKLGLI